MISTRSMYGALAFALSAALPLAGQTAHPSGTPEVSIQNNRRVPVTVYLESNPIDLKLGTVDPLSVSTLRIPEWAFKDPEKSVSFFIQPTGQLPLQADAQLHAGSRLALLIPDGSEALDPGDSRLAAVLPPSDLLAATVTVHNDRGEASDVYLQSGMMDRRLGRVEAHSETTFRVPDAFVGEHGQVVLVPLNGSTLASEPVKLEEGTHLGVRLE